MCGRECGSPEQGQRPGTPGRTEDGAGGTRRGSVSRMTGLKGKFRMDKKLVSTPGGGPPQEGVTRVVCC